MGLSTRIKIMHNVLSRDKNILYNTLEIWQTKNTRSGKLGSSHELWESFIVCMSVEGIIVGGTFDRLDQLDRLDG